MRADVPRAEINHAVAEREQIGPVVEIHGFHTDHGHRPKFRHERVDSARHGEPAGGLRLPGEDERGPHTVDFLPYAGV